MDMVSVCISFVVAILGVAYPILFQVVARLDEKYTSIIIVDLFSKEKERNLFLVSLISALISILIWTLKIRPLFKNDGLDFLIENSSTYLVLISTISLVSSFFLFVKKILIYYTPSKFLPYLMDKHKKQKKIEFNYFRAISDIFTQSIKQQNEKIALTISDFMYEEFHNQRESSSNKKVEYPSAYYELVYNATQELAANKNNRLVFLEYHTVGGLWLFGEFKTCIISETTFSWIWSNLLCALKYEKDNMRRII